MELFFFGGVCFLIISFFFWVGIWDVKLGCYFNILNPGCLISGRLSKQTTP